MLRFSKYFLAIVSVWLISATIVWAQCPMCKTNVEASLQNEGGIGGGLNAGIIMLFSTPYLLVGTLVWYWYFYRKDRKAN
jgi:hypothetical protein